MVSIYTRQNTIWCLWTPSVNWPSRASIAGRTMPYAHAIDGVTWRFPDLKTLLARASPQRSGDALAGVAAQSAEERMAARMALADLPLAAFLAEAEIGRASCRERVFEAV